MYIIDNPDQLRRALRSPLDPALECILALRLDQQLGDARFIVVEPPDTLAAVELAAGVPVSSGLVDDAVFPDPDFMPAWEWARPHRGWWEVLFLLADDDAGTVLLIPRREDIDPTLLAILRAFAEDTAATATRDQAL